MNAKANLAQGRAVSINELFESENHMLRDLGGEEPKYRQCLLCHEPFMADRADEKYCETCEGDYEMYRLPATD